MGIVRVVGSRIEKAEGEEESEENTYVWATLWRHCLGERLHPVDKPGAFSMRLLLAPKLDKAVGGGGAQAVSRFGAGELTWVAVPIGMAEPSST